MKFSLSTAICGGGLAALLSLGIYFAVTPRDLSEGVDIAANQNDPELTGSIAPGQDSSKLTGEVISVSTFGTFKRGVEKEEGSASFIASYESDYANGKPKVVKYILADQVPFMTRTGYGADHYVLYRYFREDDGSVEHEKLVVPEEHISASVMTKVQLRYFDRHNKEIEGRYVRADGTLAAKQETATDTWTDYFADGVTVRSKQVYDRKKKATVEKRFLKNGSLWYSTTYGDKEPMTTVYFDNQGHKLEQPLRFTRVFSKGGFKANGVWYERAEEDHYLRPDGTDDYTQVWFEFQDKNKPWLTEALGQVQVYNPGGTDAVTYNLDLRYPDQPLFIQTAQYYLPSGTTLLFREYSSPNHRSKETPYTIDGKALPAKVFFSANDWNEEPIANKMIFQGFDHTVWGTTDATPHDF